MGGEGGRGQCKNGDFYDVSFLLYKLQLSLGLYLENVIKSYLRNADDSLEAFQYAQHFSWH